MGKGDVIVKEYKMTRRQFLKRTGMAAAATAATSAYLNTTEALASTEVPAPRPVGKYIQSEEWADGAVIETDLLIIGTGFAGLWAAITAADQGVKSIAVVDKGSIGNSSNASMTGGGTFFLHPGEDKMDWMKELVPISDYLSRQDMWDDQLTTSYSRMEKLKSWGLEYKDMIPMVAPRVSIDGFKHVALNGNPVWNGLTAGKAVTGMLRDQMQKRKGIRYFSKTMITRLLKQDGKIAGAVGVHRVNGKAAVFKAKAVIISTGQCSFRGQYAVTEIQTGDGYALAYNAGATMTNMEFLSFETVPGVYGEEGACLKGTFGCRLLNSENRDFMWDYNPKDGLGGPARITTRAMAKEVREGRGPIRMDQTTFTFTLLGQRIWRSMLIYTEWQKLNEYRLDDTGHDVTEKPEIFYVGSFGIIGAVKADIGCGTTIPGLYVAGITLSQDPGMIKGAESARAMWSGQKSAMSAADYISHAPDVKLDLDYAEAERKAALKPLGRTDGRTPNEILFKLQEIIFDYNVSILKNESRLRDALQKVIAIKESDLPVMTAADTHELIKYYETHNMVECAELYLRASLERRETRECHYREDYPETNNKEWLKWINLTKGADGQPVIALEAVPFDQYPIKPPKEV
nr:FAD-binding protein [Dehalobacter sp. DCA]